MVTNTSLNHVNSSKIEYRAKMMEMRFPDAFLWQAKCTRIRAIFEFESTNEVIDTQVKTLRISSKREEI